jgi:hypothetical protein
MPVGKAKKKNCVFSFDFLSGRIILNSCYGGAARGRELPPNPTVFVLLVSISDKKKTWKTKRKSNASPATIVFGIVSSHLLETACSLATLRKEAAKV